MESKDAVRTCIIGRRWLNQWRSVPVIDIDGASFQDYRSLQRFTLSLFDSRSPDVSLTRARLWFDVDVPKFCFDKDLRKVVEDGVPEPVVENFILYVTGHNVRHVSLLFPRRVLQLPELFFCVSLASLDLYGLMLPSILGFSYLTSLNLTDCIFYPISTQGPSSSSVYPNLFNPFMTMIHMKTLVINRCRLRVEPIVLHISAPQLTSLTIKNMISPGLIHHNSIVKISSPRICSFKIVTSHLLIFELDSLPLLDDLCLDVARMPESLLTTNNFIDRLGCMLKGCENAKRVTLSEEKIQNIAASLPTSSHHVSPHFSQLDTLAVRVRGTIIFPVQVFKWLLKGSHPATALKIHIDEILC